MSKSVPPSLTLVPVAFDDDTEAERFFAAGEAAAETDAPPELTPELEDWGTPARPPLSSAQLLRRARLRRLVAKGLAGGVLMLLAGIAFARLPHTRAPTAASNAAAALAVRGATKRPRVGTTTLLPRPSPAPAPIESSTSVPVETSPEAAPVASSAAPEPSAAPPPSTEDAHALAMKARRLLESGRLSDGVAAARAAIATDPSRPEAYILLAAGLEDLGQWKEAQQVFTSCVRRSHQGPSAECAYFAKATR